MGMLVWLGFYGLQLWLPTLLKTVFKGELTVGLVAAIPPICAAAAIWINGRGADRDGRYNVRVAVPLIVGGVILATSTSSPPTSHGSSCWPLPPRPPAS